MFLPTPSLSIKFTTMVMRHQQYHHALLPRHILHQSVAQTSRPFIETFSAKTCSRLSESFRERFQSTTWALRFFAKRIVNVILFFVVGSGCSFEWNGSGYLCSSRRLRTSRGFFGSFLCLLFHISGSFPFLLVSPLFLFVPVGVGFDIGSSRVERLTLAQRIQSYYARRCINKSVAC